MTETVVATCLPFESGGIPLSAFSKSTTKISLFAECKQEAVNNIFY